MLHAVTTLSEDSLWKVRRRLRDEIYSDTLRADKTYNLLNLVGQRLRGVLEEHMRLVEEEDHLRKLHIAYLGHLVVNLRQEPHQERRVELRLEHKLVGRQDIHHTTSSLGLQQVVYVERWLTKELITALLGKRQERTLDSADSSRRDIAISGRVALRVLGHVVQHQAQVLHINERQILVLGDAECE